MPTDGEDKGDGKDSADSSDPADGYVERESRERGSRTCCDNGGESFVRGCVGDKAAQHCLSTISAFDGEMGQSQDDEDTNDKTLLFSHVCAGKSASVSSGSGLGLHLHQNLDTAANRQCQ